MKLACETFAAWYASPGHINCSTIPLASPLHPLREHFTKGERYTFLDATGVCPGSDTFQKQALFFIVFPVFISVFYCMYQSTVVIPELNAYPMHPQDGLPLSET